MKKQYIAPEAEVISASPVSIMNDSEGVIGVIHGNEGLFDEEAANDTDNEMQDKDNSANYNLWD